MLTGGDPSSRERNGAIDLISVDSRRKHYGRSSLLEMGSFLLRACVWAIHLKRCRWDLSIVFFGLPCGPISSLLKWRFGVPYIVSLRGGDVPGFERQVAGLHFLLSPLRRFVYRKAIRVVANSKSLAALSESRDPFKIEVIPNGVETGMFQSANYSRDGNGEIRLLMASRFHRQKRIPETLRLLDQARQAGVNFKLYLVGEGPEEKTIRKVISELDLEHCVRLTSWVETGQLISLYQSADCFLSLSYCEGMPNSVLEAMSCELPVILSDIPAHRELVQDNVTGFLVTLDDKLTLVRILRLIKNNPSKARMIGEKAREYVRQSFSWTATAKNYLSLLETHN